MGLKKPNFMVMGYDYLDKESMTRKIKDDAPDWAKKEFKEFMEKVNSKPDKKGIIAQY